MRALIVGDESILASRIGEMITRGGLGYRGVDMVPFATALGSASRVHCELMVVILPPDIERGVEAIRCLRNATEAFLLVVGPADDAKLILRVLRQGADEYVDQAELDPEFRASLVRLRAKQLSKASNGWIVGVLAASGGCGASTVATNLAVLLAQWNEQPMLVDMRVAASDLAGLLDLKPDHDLADLCRNVSRLDLNMLQQSLVQHSSGVQLLAAPNSVDDAAQVTPQGVREVLSLARVLSPYVLLDLDRSLHSEQLAGILQANLLLLVLRLDMTSLRNARRLLDYLKELGIADDRIRGVVNRYGQPKELPLRKVEQALGIAIAHQIPDDPAGMNLAGNAGVPVVLERPRASVSRALISLASEIKDSQEVYRHNGHCIPEYESVIATASAGLMGDQ